MNTLELLDGTSCCCFRDCTGKSSLSFSFSRSLSLATADEEADLFATTNGSSNWPAGVSSSPPSGLNVSRLKKFVNPSSPYNFTLAHDGVATGVRIAGSGSIGLGERPKLPPLREESDGEGTLVTELKEERRDRAETDVEVGAVSLSLSLEELGPGRNIPAVSEPLTTDPVGVGGALSVLVSRCNAVLALPFPPLEEDSSPPPKTFANAR
jgi:hypothetical protein